MSVGITYRACYNVAFRVSVQAVWSDTPTVIILISPQVVLMLLTVQEPHFGDHYSNPLLLSSLAFPPQQEGTDLPAPLGCQVES